MNTIVVFFMHRLLLHEAEQMHSQLEAHRYCAAHESFQLHVIRFQHRQLMLDTMFSKALKTKSRYLLAILSACRFCGLLYGVNVIPKRRVVDVKRVCIGCQLLFSLCLFSLVSSYPLIHFRLHNIRKSLCTTHPAISLQLYS